MGTRVWLPTLWISRASPSDSLLNRGSGSWGMESRTHGGAKTMDEHKSMTVGGQVASQSSENSVAARARRKAYLNIVLPLFITSIIAYLDRNNLSYAALTMNQDLGFTAEVFGFGAGIFFAGYVLFEIPGALIAERFSPKWWLARIMISWGLLTGLMAFVTTPWQVY